MAVSPGEEGHCRQTADDDDLQDEDGGPHDPVEGDDARTVVLAHVAAFRTRQTLVLVLVVVHALHALHKSVNISVAWPHANFMQMSLNLQMKRAPFHVHTLLRILAAAWPV